MSLCRLARGPLSLHGSPCTTSTSSSSSRRASLHATAFPRTSRQQRRPHSSSALPSLRSSPTYLFPLLSSNSIPSPLSFLIVLRRSHSKAGPPSPPASLNPTTTNMAAATASTSALKSGAEARSRKGDSSVASKPARSHSTKSGHDHQHDHGIFGHTHSHAGDTEEAAALAAAFSGAGDKGSRIILLGLASNILLTAAKGVGGYMLHSASLLADAGHSLSDLLGDIVVLFSWRLSRRPASRGFQYGYGKFEALGSLAVATALIGGALGIGVHSYFLFLHALSHAAVTAAPELAHAADTMLNSTSSSVLSSIGGHAHVHALDPNAAWIALFSVLIKEWMYRATLKVAKEERSNVLEANALHHRSDVFSGCLAGVAILGSSMGFPMLDPVGGLLVAGMIIKQGSEIGLNAMKELVDYAIDPELTGQIEHWVLSMQEDSAAVTTTDTHDHEHKHDGDHAHSHDSHASSDLKLPIRSVSAVRTFKSGSFTLADMAIGFPPNLTVAQASKVADQIADSVKSQFPCIKEVVVRFDAEENLPPFK